MSSLGVAPFQLQPVARRRLASTAVRWCCDSGACQDGSAVVASICVSRVCQALHWSLSWVSHAHAMCVLCAQKRQIDAQTDRHTAGQGITAPLHCFCDASVRGKAEAECRSQSLLRTDACRRQTHTAMNDMHASRATHALKHHPYARLTFRCSAAKHSAFLWLFDCEVRPRAVKFCMWSQTSTKLLACRRGHSAPDRCHVVL